MIKNNMNGIELLDCTLRDGGHITGSYFGKEVIYDIAQKMIQSRIDILEVGFLKDCVFNPDYALYNNCLLYTSPSPRDLSTSRMPSSA